MTEMKIGTVLHVRDDDENEYWFLRGSEVTVVADCGSGGLIVCGHRRCATENEAAVMGRALGDVYEDEELCARDEFKETSAA